MIGLIVIPGFDWQLPGMIPFMYLDPGSGSMIIQLIIAGVLGALFFFRGYVRKFMDKFRKPQRPEEETDDHEDW